jgi:4-amino-4-deoxy-L-arabinose transferase-like glycosyltransferase
MTSARLRNASQALLEFRHHSGDSSLRGTRCLASVLRRMRRRQLFLPLGIAFLGLGINLIVACKTGRTTDEAAHLAYGDSILRGSAVRANLFFNSKMPVTALNSAPRMIGGLLAKRGLAPVFTNELQDIRAARMATVAAAFGLCLLVYFFAQSLYGRVAGLFAELVFIVSPNLIAHSTLATTDLYVSLGTIASLYCLRRFLLRPNTPNALLVAAVLGLAQLTKFSAAYLYLVVAIVLASVGLYAKYSRNTAYRVSRRQIASLLSFTVICFLLFINVGFVFDRTFTPLAQYKFITPAFQALQHVPVLREIPLPLPYAYLDGFDSTGYDNNHAVTFGNITLLGEVRGTQLARSDGFPSYYLVAYALKEPIGLQLLLLLGIGWVIRHRPVSEFLAAEYPLFLTAGVLLTVFSFFSNTQIGIRHILPVLAIFSIVSGAPFANFLDFSPRRRILILSPVLYATASVASYFPYMIPYFNEFVGDRKMAYRFLADSNLDWKQDRDEVAAFIAKNPTVALDPPEPVTGWVLVRANLLAGVEPKTANYWLRRRALKPVGHVAYAHLLFRIPP